MGVQTHLDKILVPAGQTKTITMPSNDRPVQNTTFWLDSQGVTVTVTAVTKIAGVQQNTLTVTGRVAFDKIYSETGFVPPLSNQTNRAGGVIPMTVELSNGGGTDVWLLVHSICDRGINT